jgi:hypothetical protein
MLPSTPTGAVRPASASAHVERPLRTPHIVQQLLLGSTKDSALAGGGRKAWQARGSRQLHVSLQTQHTQP